MAAKSSSRDGRAISLVAIHTNEGDNPADVYPDRTAENLADYLDRPGVQASYHQLVDDDSEISYLPDGRAAWALRSGNSRSLNLCFTGWARWDRAEWLRHDGMLRRGAAVVREWCEQYGIPMVKIGPDAVGRDEAGVIGHHDWTVGKSDGTHWDPGYGFPWDHFMRLVTEGDDMPSAREIADAMLDTPIQRKGSTQDPDREPTTLRTIAQWWDHAQVLDRQATAALSEQVRTIVREELAAAKKEEA